MKKNFFNIHVFFESSPSENGEPISSRKTVKDGVSALLGAENNPDITQEFSRNLLQSRIPSAQSILPIEGRSEKTGENSFKKDEFGVSDTTWKHLKESQSTTILTLNDTSFQRDHFLLSPEGSKIFSQLEGGMNVSMAASRLGNIVGEIILLNKDTKSLNDWFALKKKEDPEFPDIQTYIQNPTKALDLMKDPTFINSSFFQGSKECKLAELIFDVNLKYEKEIREKILLHDAQELQNVKARLDGLEEEKNTLIEKNIERFQKLLSQIPKDHDVYKMLEYYDAFTSMDADSDTIEDAYSSLIYDFTQKYPSENLTSSLEKYIGDNFDALKNNPRLQGLNLENTPETIKELAKNPGMIRFLVKNAPTDIFSPLFQQLPSGDGIKSYLETLKTFGNTISRIESEKIGYESAIKQYTESAIQSTQATQNYYTNTRVGRNEVGDQVIDTKAARFESDIVNKVDGENKNAGLQNEVKSYFTSESGQGTTVSEIMDKLQSDSSLSEKLKSLPNGFELPIGKGIIGKIEHSGGGLSLTIGGDTWNLGEKNPGAEYRRIQRLTMTPHFEKLILPMGQDAIQAIYKKINLRPELLPLHNKDDTVISSFRFSYILTKVLDSIANNSDDTIHGLSVDVPLSGAPNDTMESFQSYLSGNSAGLDSLYQKIQSKNDSLPNEKKVLDARGQVNPATFLSLLDSVNFQVT